MRLGFSIIQGGYEHFTVLFMTFVLTDLGGFWCLLLVLAVLFIAFVLTDLGGFWHLLIVLAVCTAGKVVLFDFC